LLIGGSSSREADLGLAGEVAVHALEMRSSRGGSGTWAAEADDDQAETGSGADQLRGEERQHGGGGDAREGIGERPADRDGRVGEGRGGGEPVRRADV
jgi:hypothetical protein